MSENPFARGAPIWRQQGWMGTLWLPPGAKSPPPRDYTGRLGELEISDDQVAQWAINPGNLGIRLPQGVVGIDVDWYKPDGQVSYGTLVHECGELPPTYKSSARPLQPHSGVYLYRVDWQLELHDKPLPGIEIIQWFHRYICTWPSIHPEGEMYRLTDPRGMMGVRPPLIDELPWLPEAWLKRLVQVQRPTGVNKPAQYTGGWSPAVSKAYAEGQVALAGAGRHDSTRTAIDALTRLECSGHPGAAEAKHLLGTQFVAAITADGTRTPAEAHSELERMLRGAEDLIESTPSYRPSWEDLRAQRNAVPVGVSGSGTVTPDTDETGWAFGDLRGTIEAGLEPEIAKVLARTDGTCLLYVGKVNTLFGQSGSGKTWVGLAAIAQEIRQGHHCLYVDWEDDIRTFARRLLNLGCEPADVIEYAHYISPLAPATPTIIEWLVSHGFNLVVLDSTGEGIAAQGGLNQNDDGDVAVWMRALPRPLAWAGTCVVLIDHVPKTISEGGTVQEIGSQRKRAAVSGASYEVIQTEPYSKHQAGKLILRTGKDRGGNWSRGQVVAECRMAPVGEEGDLIVEIGVPLWTNDQGETIRPSMIMERVSIYIERNPGCTVRDIQTVKGRKETKTQALAILLDEGYISTSKVGQRIEHRSERPYREQSDPVLQPPEALE